MVNTFQQILDDPALPRAYLIEVSPWDNSIPAQVKVGFGDSNAPEAVLHYDGFFWSPKVKRVFSSQLAPVAATLALGSRNAPQIGQIDLTIGDTASVPDSIGVVRDLRTLEYDGRKIRVLLGDPTGVFADFGEILVGTVEDVQWTDQLFSLSVSNRANLLDTPIQENLFAGDGTEGEGNANLKKVPKPLLYGVKRNLAPILLDEGLGIYRIHEGAIDSILGIFDRGNALTDAGDITTLSLPSLTNWTPEGGKYVTDLASGTFRVGATPDGPLTVDAQGDNAGGFVKKLGEILERILTTKGPLLAADIDSTALTTFNTDRAGDSGFYVPAGGQILSILQTQIDAVGGLWFFGRDGVLVFKVFKFAGTPAATLTETSLTASPTRVQSAPPLWQVRIGYKKLGLIQDLSEVELPSRAASEPANLLGANANTAQTGAFAYYDKKLLSEFDGGSAADAFSFGVWFTDPTSNVVNMRAQILFFNGADAQVGSTAEGNFVVTATALTRSVVENVAIPSGAVKITVQTTGDSGFADVNNSFAMLNRGTVALPFIPAQGAIGSVDSVDLSTSQVAGSLPVAKADTGLKNTSVTLAATGVLSGGGSSAQVDAKQVANAVADAGATQGAPAGTNVGGTLAETVEAQALVPSQNLLGADAGVDHIVSGGYEYSGFEIGTAMPLTTLNLGIGDVISFGGLAKIASTSSDLVSFTMRFKDAASGGSQVGSANTPTTGATAFTLLTAENITIPASTTHIEFRGTFNASTVNHSFFRASINRGPKYLAFMEPPIRAERESAADLKFADGTTTIEARKPAEIGAEVTAGKSFTVMIDRTLDNVTDTSTRFAAIEAGANKTETGTSNDTSFVSGTAAATVKDGAVRANTGLTATGDVAAGKVVPSSIASTVNLAASDSTSTLPVAVGFTTIATVTVAVDGHDLSFVFSYDFTTATAGSSYRLVRVGNEGSPIRAGSYSGSGSINDNIVATGEPTSSNTYRLQAKDGGTGLDSHTATNIALTLIGAP